MSLLRKSLKSLLPNQLRTLATKSIGIDVVDSRIGLTDDQIQYLNLARNFADKELFPNAKRWDEESHFPVDVFEKFGSLGFGGISVDSDYGGSNLSRVDNVVIIEGLGMPILFFQVLKIDIVIIISKLHHVLELLQC